MLSDNELYTDGNDGTGIRDTDFVLYISANSTMETNIAEARHCHQDPIFER